MKKNKRFFSKFMTAAAVFASLFVVCDLANAATRRSGRSVPAARKNITATKTVATTQPVEQNSEPETIVETVEEPVVTVAKEIPEQIIMNKSNQFENTISDIMESAAPDNSFAEEIRRQRAALAASESESTATGNQQRALATNSHTCDVGLRKCMSEICGKDFTKCATDGDTAFGDKLDRCRRNTECSAEEFSLFTTEIKADRDVNVKLSSYNSVVECGNSYNACIMNECGTMYNKCLGKTAENAAIQKCSTVAKECNEADSGLTSRFGTAIGKLRENAEKDIKKDEQRLYTLRDLMEKQCKSLGAAFDERSFDCVYTVNFYAGENQSAPLASRKAYAGDSFVCMQEWFGVNTTTAQENAYRETRAQTAASSAMLGSGLGMAAGAISSGAIDRAIDTTKKCKELEAEWEATQMSTCSGSYYDCAEFWKEKSEKLDKLQKEMAECKATEQSNANRLLTAASSVATGIGGKELAQGLAEQKADRVAEQSMSAYIATMRCSYGNGKQVKAGTEEIELPGGNDGNIMKYRAEYVTLAADLKERKTALGLKPGIESEEILDKSQMGLYDDENIGISDGAYASLYRAQMLGSEKDQQQIDDAKQTSKNRVIGGAVAAGVGVVGGIIGDELINQSLSSSTKTAQTCTESGGTWQGGRCHCPDGFIQHTKTGPCFEEKPTEVQTTTNQQTPVESSNSPPPQGQNNNSSNSNSSSDNSHGDGDNDDNDESNFDFEFDDIVELDEEVEPLPEPIITYEKQQNCKTSNGQWINGTCVCQDSQYTPDVSGKCVYNFGSINQPTVIPVPPNDTTGVNSDGSQTNSSVTPTNDDNDEQNFDFDFGDITETDEEVEPLPEPVITYEKQRNCQKSNGQWINGTCVCQDSQYTPDVSGKCVYNFGSINQPTVIPVLPNDTTGVNSDGSQTNSSVTPTNVAAQTNPNIDASQQTDTPTCGVVGKKECNSNYYVCASDSDCTSDKLPANATAGHCWKSGSRSVCTATACKDGFEPKSGYCQKRAIADRNTDSQKSNTQTAQRPSTTEAKKNNDAKSSTNQSKKTVEERGVFANTQVTEDQAKKLIKLWAKRKGIKIDCPDAKKDNTTLICNNSTTIYHFTFEDLTESFKNTQNKSIAIKVCELMGGRKKTEIDTGLDSRINCDIDFDVCRGKLNEELKTFNQKSYIHNVYNKNGSTETWQRSYCTIDY